MASDHDASPHPALNGYPEKKRRANGETVTVYVQPYHVDLLQDDGTVKARQYRKVQSEPYDPSNPRAIQRAVKEATIRAAERAAAAREAIEAHQKQTAAQNTPQTLRQVAAEAHATSVRFDARGKPRDLRGGTKKKYAKNVANLARSELGALADLPLASITVGDARRHFKAFSSCHVATSSSKYRSYLNQIGGYAAACGYWPRNLFSELPAIAVPEADAEDNLALSLLDIRKLNQQARKTGNPRLPAYLRLLRLGLRASEILALSEDDLDRAERTITVRYSLVQDQPDWALAQGRSSKAYLEETKTRESRRVIQVHASFMVDILGSLDLAKPYAVPAYDDGGHTRSRRYVVPNKQGNVWLYNNALRMVRSDVFLEARIDLRRYESGGGSSKVNARWNHIWRNTYAADLVALGADDLQLAHLVRHSDASLSKRVYASARLEQREAYRSFAERINHIRDFNWQIGAIDEDVESNPRSRFTTRQASIRDVVRPKLPDNIDDLF